MEILRLVGTFTRCFDGDQSGRLTGASSVGTTGKLSTAARQPFISTLATVFS